MKKEKNPTQNTVSCECIEVIERRVPVQLRIAGARLLSVNEARTLVSRGERRSTWLQTPKGEVMEYGMLRSPCLSNYDGRAKLFYNELVDRELPVRPVVVCENLEETGVDVGDRVKIGNHYFKVISKKLLWSEESIGSQPYTFQGRTNAYEGSYVQTAVNKWFNRDIANDKINERRY